MANINEPDIWSDGDLYEGYTGRWSRLVANDFLAWLDRPLEQVAAALDMGCGTGALSESLIANGLTGSLTSLDRSDDYLAYARRRITAENVRFVQGDVHHTGLTHNSFDLIVSGLVVNFVDSPIDMLNEMAELGKHGAAIGLYVWDFADGMEPIRRFWDAAHACAIQGVEELDAGNRFPICQPYALLDAVTLANWQQPEVCSIEIATRFANFNDYWAPFLSGQGTAPAFAVGMSEDQREAVRITLLSMVTDEPDTPFTMNARAWAVKGVAP